MTQFEQEPLTAMSQPMRVLTSRATNEWYTPATYIDLGRSVLGRIDLDPASDALPQGWIQAATYFNAEADGLSREWYGRVWLNPSFNDTARWVDKLTAEHLAGRVSEALLLVNSNAGYRWYEELWRRWPVCCVRERIRFIRADGTTIGKAKRAQTFVYLGRNRERFIEVFHKLGRVILP